MIRAAGERRDRGATWFPDGRSWIDRRNLPNPDGSFQRLVDRHGPIRRAIYFPQGFSCHDCAVLDNGDVLVLERRYVPLGILVARLTLVDGKNIQLGQQTPGQRIAAIGAAARVDNFEGVAVQQTSKER